MKKEIIPFLIIPEILPKRDPKEALRIAEERRRARIKRNLKNPAVLAAMKRSRQYYSIKNRRNLRLMNQKELYDKLQELLPEGMQFVDPYQNKIPLPKGDYATMTLLSVDNISLSQTRTVAVALDKYKTAKYAHDWNRIYNVQFDFFGPNAFVWCEEYQHRLVVSLHELKSASQIRNMTFLEPGSRWVQRWNFDVALYVVDTFTDEQPYFDKFKVDLIGYGQK